LDKREGYHGGFAGTVAASERGYALGTLRSRPGNMEDTHALDLED
jgi:hypothetical protein